MATFLSLSPAPSATLPAAPKIKSTMCQQNSFPIIRGPMVGGLRLTPMTRIQFTKAAKKSFPLPSSFKTTISCSTAQPETLHTVQIMIAKQLSIDESTVTPQTKFVDLGADSLDTVEIMMALEEKFGVSIGESGAENIVSVQDAADLIEKVKADSA